MFLTTVQNLVAQAAPGICAPLVWYMNSLGIINQGPNSSFFIQQFSLASKFRVTEWTLRC